MTTNYAHSLPNHPIETWQTLNDHLTNVALLAGKYARSFHSETLASIIGSLHDCGKASTDFQNYLAKTQDSEEDIDAEKHTKGPDHSTAGAQWLDSTLPGMGRLLAYIISGHHSGLPDGISAGLSSLSDRLNKKIPDWQSRFKQKLPTANELMIACKNEATRFLSNLNGFATSFYLRMLFSCLVDADFLDTEHFLDNERAHERNAGKITAIETLLAKLLNYYKSLDEKVALDGNQDSPVMLIRNEVREDCQTASQMRKGLFTLKVPTGGGKTLSSMLFALKHASFHKMDRIIYVVPFTTIIEQNAEIFREIFGEENVLEIHCNVDPEGQSEHTKLLCENWDAPIIVTTNVQFFESMFAHKTSRCRKLHNFANAVIILDEAQGIPVDLLKPCLMALEELTVRYNSSVVLCTATLPLFFDHHILGDNALTGGDNGIVDIVPTERNLHDKLKRVTVRRIPEKVSDSELVVQLSHEDSTLVVVSTRRHAKELYLLAKEAFPDRQVFHLSALMCGVHRSEIIQKVKSCLNLQQPCILISTQLIEAGVDIDFPCVYREIAGVDSMAQAAGRCNREGKLSCGTVILFESKDFETPHGFLNDAAQQGRLVTLLPEKEIADDLLGPIAVNKYFEGLFSNAVNGNPRGMDRYGVLTDLIPRKLQMNKNDLLVFKFKTLGENFHLIIENTCNVIVPYGETGISLCEQLRSSFVPSEQRKLAQKLQRYTVSTYSSEPRDKDGYLIAEKVHDVYWILSDTSGQYYSNEYGMRSEAENGFLEI